jgi:elongation factor 2 kinase
MKVQAKYNEDEETISDEDASAYSGDGLKPNNKFQRLDVNRLRRSLALKSPRDLLGPNESATMRRSNVSRLDISKSIRSSLRGGSHFKVILRTSSDVDELQMCLERAKKDLEFTLRHDFHRSASGDLRARHFKTGDKTYFHKSNVFCAVSAPMIPSEETENNLGKVHYQLAVLHGSERFPDVVPDHPGDNREDRPSHDAFSVLFHLSYAAALQNAPACLALARLHAGLGTVVSDLLSFVVSTDFEAAKDLLRRAMASSQLPSKPKAAAGCLLFQLLHDEVALQEGNTSSEFIMQVVEDTLELLVVTEKEAEDVKIHNSRLERGAGMYVGDKVEANYAMEGTLYSAVVVAVSEDGESITVAYDDDGSEETHTKENVKVLIASTATQTAEGAPLSDEEAFGSEAGDDKFLLSLYESKAELADLKEKVGDKSTASRLYEEAADGAMTDGKMQTATKWSIKAAELQP